jgi:hypothetical protein
MRKSKQTQDWQLITMFDGRVYDMRGFSFDAENRVKPWNIRAELRRNVDLCVIHFLVLSLIL